MNFHEQLQYYQNKAEKFLTQYCAGKTGLIMDSVRYSLLAGGKRIRPVLAMAHQVPLRRLASKLYGI